MYARHQTDSGPSTYTVAHISKCALLWRIIWSSTNPISQAGKERLDKDSHRDLGANSELLKTPMFKRASSSFFTPYSILGWQHINSMPVMWGTESVAMGHRPTLFTSEQYHLFLGKVRWRLVSYNVHQFLHLPSTDDDGTQARGWSEDQE